MSSQSSDFSSRHSCVLSSPIPPEILRKTLGVSLANSAKSRDYRAVDASIENLLNGVAEHKWGSKDGLILMPGTLEGSRRLSSKVLGISVMMFDIDDGQSFDEIAERLNHLGMLYFMYTSYSHRKAQTIVRLDHLMTALKIQEGHEILLPTLQSYLADVKGYSQDVVNSVHRFSFHDSDCGKQEIHVHHGPMDKFRVGLPLAEPFVPRRYGSSKRAQIAWERLLEAVAGSLDLSFDRACLDMARGFYLPRHAPGQPFKVRLGGSQLLDLDEVTPIEPSKKAPRSPAPSLSSTQQALQEAPQVGEEYSDLVKVLRKYGPTLDIVDLLINRIGWETRGDPVNGKVSILCPNDDEHSNPGDDADTGCVAMNPEATNCGRAVITCQHAHCRQLQTSAFLAKICEQVNMEGILQ